MAGVSTGRQPYCKRVLSVMGKTKIGSASCFNYLEKDLSGPLTVVCEETGEGSVDGSTRRKVTAQREGLRHEVLTKSLQHGAKEAA